MTSHSEGRMCTMATPMSAPQYEAFDGSVYDLPIPKDSRGRKAEGLALAIGGTLELDRTSEDDLALINALRAGEVKSVHVIATLEGGGEGWSYPVDSDGITRP